MEKSDLLMKIDRERSLLKEQISIETTRLFEKHRKDIAERIKYNQSHLKRFERDQDEKLDNELKRFQQDQAKQYKIKKEAMKKVKNKRRSSSRDFLFIFRKLRRISIGIKMKKKMKSDESKKIYNQSYSRMNEL